MLSNWVEEQMVRKLLWSEKKVIYVKRDRFEAVPVQTLGLAGGMWSESVISLRLKWSC